MPGQEYFKEGDKEEIESPNPEKIFGPIKRDHSGRIIEGLPEGMGEKDVRTFIGPDGQEYAASPSEQVLEAEKFWRDELNPEE